MVFSLIFLVGDEYSFKYINKLGSRSLSGSGKLNSSSTQVLTLRVTWSLELVTIIAMPPPPTIKLFV